MPEREHKNEINRRQFLDNLLRSACGVALVGLGLGIYARRAASLPAQVIRPPGALPEADFLGACIRCGLCVRDCPYEKRLDTQVLFYPFKKQLYLPTIAIEFGDGQRRQSEIVGQKDKLFVGLDIVILDPTKLVGIVLGSIETSQRNGLIAA
jgi:ferredoxin